MNQQRVTLLIMLDLSAAFDTVHHGCLLSILNSKLGLDGIALQWFDSYLKNRSYRVSVNGELSKLSYPTAGLPQGSCLGPLLFNIYASGVLNIVKKHLPQIHCYVDDSQLYLSFNPDNEDDQYHAVQAMENCLIDIRKWAKSNYLKLNDDKTEFVIIRTKQQLAKTYISTIRVGNTDIVASSHVRNLGAWFDERFSTETHITKTCGSAFYHLHNIRRIRKYLSQDIAETLIHAFVTSRIDYCNSLLFGLPSFQISKIQRVQNAAARVALMKSKYCHITPLLKELHWPPVTYRIQFKVILITFRALNDMATSYISSLLLVRQDTRYSLRCNNAILLTPPLKNSVAKTGDRSFTMAAPILWNSLPSEIRNIHKLEKFKQCLKTYFYRLAFQTTSLIYYFNFQTITGFLA